MTKAGKTCDQGKGCTSGWPTQTESDQLLCAVLPASRSLFSSWSKRRVCPSRSASSSRAASALNASGAHHPAQSPKRNAQRATSHTGAQNTSHRNGLPPTASAQINTHEKEEEPPTRVRKTLSMGQKTNATPATRSRQTQRTRKKITAPPRDTVAGNTTHTEEEYAIEHAHLGRERRSATTH